MINIKNIHSNNWGSSRISIIGAGKSGIAAAQLGKHLGSEIFISDNNDSPDIQKNVESFRNETGGHSNKVLEAHLIVISPGVPDSIPIIQECRKQNTPIVSEIEFASWFTKSPILTIPISLFFSKTGKCLNFLVTINVKRSSLLSSKLHVITFFVINS